MLKNSFKMLILSLLSMTTKRSETIIAHSLNPFLSLIFYIDESKSTLPDTKSIGPNTATISPTFIYLQNLLSWLIIIKSLVIGLVEIIREEWIKNWKWVSYWRDDCCNYTTCIHTHHWAKAKIKMDNTWKSNHLL